MQYALILESYLITAMLSQILKSLSGSFSTVTQGYYEVNWQ